MCISSFKRITLVMMMVFYIYAVIGTQFLSYSDEDYHRLKEENPSLAYYESGVSRNFRTFHDSFFTLFQMLTESNWHLVILYHEIFHGVYFTACFLIPFHFLITFIMRSILLGMTWEVFGVINAQQNEEEDYLVQSIKVKGDFKIELETNDFPNERIQVTQKMLKSRQISMNNIANMMLPIEQNKSEMEFDKLYKAFFAKSSTEEDYKSFHRFVRRSTLNTCLKPKDFNKFKKMQKYKSNHRGIFRSDFHSELFPSVVAPRDHSSHSCKSFREHKKLCSYETKIALVGNDFETISSSSWNSN